MTKSGHLLVNDSTKIGICRVRRTLMPPVVDGVRYLVNLSRIRDSRLIFDLDEGNVVNSASTVVVLTAIPVEREAVRRHLCDIRREDHRAGTIFLVGRLPNSSWRVVLTQTGQGNPRAAALAERAFSRFEPDLAMFVGVAGRLHADLSLGDVVVANKIYAVHGGKGDDAGFRPRPECWSADHGFVERAKEVAESSAWRIARPGRFAAKAVVRPIASGEVVLDSVNSRLARLIRQQYGDAAAIEMESAGVALAGQLNKGLPIAVVRGISDCANGQKEKTDRIGWQLRAARNAAAFAMAMLADAEPAPQAAISWVEEVLLAGTTDQRIRVVRELGAGRQANAVSLLVKGFEATPDTEVSCRIIWAIGELRTTAAEKALRSLKPRYAIERDALATCLKQLYWQKEAHKP